MEAPPVALVTLDLVLPPAELPALRRRLALGRARPVCITWHDDSDGTLARDGLALSAVRVGRATSWRVEAIVPTAEHPCSTGAPPPRLAEAPELADLHGIALPDQLMPLDRLDGRVREGLLGHVALRLLEGRGEDGVAVARLQLSGPIAETTDLALALAGSHRLGVPARSLPAELLTRAGRPVPPPRLGAPELPAGLPPGVAFAAAAAHLLAVVLHHAPRAAAGQTGEPVHQMRVALRRLRALVSLFRPAIDCPELEAVRPGLKALAAALGPARDWDVFLAGTGRAVSAAFPQEDALATLLAAASARRDAAYAALVPLLEGPALREMALRTAILVQARPWEGVVPDGPADTAAFGDALLARRLRRLARRARGIATMPEPELHEMRLDAKRLRYAAEVFAPLHPGHESRRFLKRLAALQEKLGHLNDGVVAAGLMQTLAGEGGTGLAGGVVRGFVAARAADTRAEIGRAWKRLRKVAPFWG